MGISSTALSTAEGTALYLEQRLLEQGPDTGEATGRLISASPFTDSEESEPTQQYSVCLYGNAGKRKAVEQFFLMILQEKEPQTLLLFSDENMAWLYEDAAFADRWAELFTHVILKGNRVRIIHTVTRNMINAFWDYFKRVFKVQGPRQTRFAMAAHKTKFKGLAVCF